MDCEKCYVGQTGRPFSVRLNEHQKFSGPVGKLATFDHHVVSGHNLDFTSSKIFWPEYRDDNRLILESLFIKSNNVFDNNSCSRDLKILT